MFSANRTACPENPEAEQSPDVVYTLEGDHVAGSQVDGRMGMLLGVGRVLRPQLSHEGHGN